MEPTAVEDFFSLLQQAEPDPASDLHYTTPFELLVAVVLSAQSTDVGVNRATPALFARANTAKAMVQLGEEGIRDHIRTLGLYNAKARHIHALSQQLLDQFGGRVPETRAELQSLPGVGRKSANVVLNVAFGQPTLAVDTHIFRVANRTGLAPGKTPDQVEQRLLQIVPERFLLHAHHWLLRHGRYRCRARQPLCHQQPCLVQHCCHYYHEIHNVSFMVGGGGGLPPSV
ncbi:MAG: endonuclease III [Magnetococcales bacterium]|nr:endonuclease III [Magnetococcales bacterium]